MNRDKVIKKVIGCLYDAYAPDDDEGQELIEALKQELKQEPCDDCINRKALIERINRAEKNFKNDNMDSISSDEENPFIDGVLSAVFNIRQMVVQAPSVQPKTKPYEDDEQTLKYTGQDTMMSAT